MINKHKRKVIVIGAGLTGLSTAFFLKQRNIDVLVVEKNNRLGGQIQTYKEDGFVYESGPNTGVLSYPEIVEMFSFLSEKCSIDVARDEAKKRLIWKGDRFHSLPDSLLSAIKTPLFRFKDKLKILGEPWREKGNNPDENVAQLVVRRLGRSFLDYAVDPFLSGVYAGNPETLITRYALPKLYNLEQNYGSFIKGSLAKRKEPKTQRDKLATKKVFSANGGLSTLIVALAEYIGSDNIITGVSNTRVMYNDGTNPEKWNVSFVYEGKECSIDAENVITTIGSYGLPDLLPFIEESIMNKINNLVYAPVIQAAVCYKNVPLKDFQVFGGLVPSCEKMGILGILNPSACFPNRTPDFMQDKDVLLGEKAGNTLAVFMGGVRHPEYLDKSDGDLTDIVTTHLEKMLGVTASPDLIRIFRHKNAIPQYELNSGERFEAIAQAENQYNGLFIKGNLCNGIGMGDRIHQAYETALLIS